MTAPRHRTRRPTCRLPRLAARAALAALNAVVAGTAFADTVPAQGFREAQRKAHRACRTDYKRIFPLYKVSSAQLRACMEAKASQISSDCINALVESGLVDENDRTSDRR